MEDIFRKHQIRIAKRTLELSDSGAKTLGGMTKDEAQKILADAANRKKRQRCWVKVRV